MSEIIDSETGRILSPEPERMPQQQAASYAFMRPYAAHWIALGFGSGLVKTAPGTVGTLWAWAVFSVLNPFLNDWAWAGLIVVSTLLGLWACKKTALRMGVADPGNIVWDEIVAFWLVLWLLQPAGFGAELAAFILFRFFDSVKFGLVSLADKHFKGFGWRGAFGIMLDDFAAAFMTLLLMAWWRS
jgi:phosphatidylglycerophosphatase A